jgi:hypothetical protein
LVPIIKTLFCTKDCGSNPTEEAEDNACLPALHCWYIDTIKTAPQCISLRPHSRLAAAERLQACQTQERLIFPRLQSSPPCCCHKQGNDLAFIHSLHTIAILLSGAPLTHCTCDRHTIMPALGYTCAIKCRPTAMTSWSLLLLGPTSGSL